MHELSIVAGTEPSAVSSPSKRTFRYRKHIALGAWVLPGFLLVVALGMASVLAFLEIGLSPSLMGLLFLLIAEAAVIALILGRLARTRFLIEDKGVHVVSGARRKSIPFDQITRIDFPSIRYFGGWMRIQGPEGSIRATVTLQDIALFAELVLQGAREGRSGRWSSQGAERFLRTAVLADHGWARYEDRPILAVGPLVGMLAVVAIGTSLGLPFLYVLDASVAYALMTLFAVVISEIRLAWKLRRRLLAEGAPNRITRDLSADAVHARWLMGAFGGLGVAAAAGMAWMSLLAS